MKSEHFYKLTVRWTGNKGTGTSNYSAYERSHIVSVDNRPDIAGSSDPAFRGDQTKYNPEILLVASLSSCHMLWYLHLCSAAGVVITDYSDQATGIMIQDAGGEGRFKEVILRPVVTVADSSMKEKAMALHKKANALCFIANSVNFKVAHNPACFIQTAV